MTDLTLGQVLGGYRLDQVAGRGGMGVVYRATQVRLDRVVALKVIAPELASDPAFRERFQREARLLASVDDPHVVPVYEADEVDDKLLLSMRWIDGGDLAGEIARTGSLEPERAQQLLAQVAAGLDAVHEHGLVHGDLKPANMLIERRSAGGERAYLSDFGAGRSLEATASGNWLGTVDYVAPETIRGAPPDARSDRYGLACVLFEALTGAPPFHRDTAWATMWAHYSDPIPSACERRPALPRAVDAVLARGLAKDPDERYASAERLMQALGDALVAGRGEATGPVDRPVAPVGRSPAGPPSAGPGFPRAAAPKKSWASRRRLAVAGGVLVVACAIAAAAIALASNSSPTHPRRAPTPATINRTPLGAGTQAIRVTGDGETAYVLDQFGPYVDVVQPGGEPTRIALPSKPRSIALDSAHKRLWVGLADNKLLEITLAGNKVVGTVGLPLDPDDLAVLPGEVVAQQGNPARLARVDSSRLRLLGGAVTPAGPQTSSSALIPYRGGVLATLEFPVRLEQFNASLQRVADHPIAVALPTVMALDSTGFVWVADYDGARVWRLDPSSGAPVGAAIPVGQDPTGLAVSGEYVWVMNAGDDTVTLINEQNQPLKVSSMPIGGGAGPLASSGDFSGDAWLASGTQLLQLTPAY
ncbi:MAG TPA: serine/threonine-protein kinase [Solirubrobacteraceae bacterium]|nr:serine/threonine-protein kinase [Solirubrobacteraceae bacterium]